MALSGKVARLRLCCAAAVGLVSVTSALAAPLLPSETHWKPDLPLSDAFKAFYSPTYSTADLPPGLTPVESNFYGSVMGELVGGVTTNVYRNPINDHLFFEYVISRENAGIGAISMASLDGAGWASVDIPSFGIAGTGTSGTGDPAAEWTDGKPYFVTRDPQLKTPSWTFRAGGLAGNPPVAQLVGTLIGAGDTSAHIWFETTATSRAPGFMALSTDSGLVGRANVLVPMVPEPASLVLLSAGGLLLARRRNRVR